MFERNRHVRIRQRVLTHDGVDVVELGRLALEELLARRRIKEQIGDFDGRSRRAAGGPHLAHVAALDSEFRTCRSVRTPRAERQPRDRTDRRQRLPTKAETRHAAVEVGAVAEFARCVLGDRHRKLVAGNAVAVVANANGVDSAGLDANRDPGCPRIKAVFEQFFDHRGGPFDDLAGGNPLDSVAVERFDRTRFGWLSHY